MTFVAFLHFVGNFAHAFEGVVKPVDFVVGPSTLNVVVMVLVLSSKVRNSTDHKM